VPDVDRGGFGDEKFRKLLVPERKATPSLGAPTLYMTVSAIFLALHFILMQITVLILSLVAKTLDFSLAEALPNALTRGSRRAVCPPCPERSRSSENPDIRRADIAGN